MDNGIDAVEPPVVEVTDVAQDHLGRLATLTQRLLAPEQAVQDADLVALLQEHAHEDTADVSTAAGHEDPPDRLLHHVATTPLPGSEASRRRDRGNLFPR